MAQTFHPLVDDWHFHLSENPETAVGDALYGLTAGETLPMGRNVDPEQELELPGGNMGTVVRVGDTVRRTTGAWTPAVHALLDYLADVDFEAAPRVLGLDDRGREILTFIEGDTVVTPVPDQVWFDTLSAGARLLRRFHDLSIHFTPPAGAVWRDRPENAGAHEVICHSDWAPYNAIFRGGRLVAMIDWDFAVPGSRLFDLAWCALMWCPLAPPERFNPDLPEPVDQPTRLRELCDAYGLQDRLALIDAIYERTRGALEFIEEGAAAGDPARRKMFTEGHADRYRRVLTHLDRTHGALEAALA
jgi:hypothetical protein